MHKKQPARNGPTCRKHTPNKKKYDAIASAADKKKYKKQWAIDTFAYVLVEKTFEESYKEWVPEYMLKLMEDRVGNRGLDLNDLAALGAAIEDALAQAHAHTRLS